MKGSDLNAVRARGITPASVWIADGGEPSGDPVRPVLVLEEDEAIDRLDLRWARDLRIHIMAHEVADWQQKLIDRLFFFEAFEVVLHFLTADGAVDAQVYRDGEPVIEVRS